MIKEKSLFLGHPEESGKPKYLPKLSVEVRSRRLQQSILISAGTFLENIIMDLLRLTFWPEMVQKLWRTLLMDWQQVVVACENKTMSSANSRWERFGPPLYQF